MTWVLRMPVSDIHPAASSSMTRDVGDEVEAEPTVLLGNRDAEEPELLHRRDERLRVLVGVLEVGRHRDDVLLDEASHGGDELVSYLGVRRHGRILRSERKRGGVPPPRSERPMTVMCLTCVPEPHISR